MKWFLGLAAASVLLTGCGNRKEKLLGGGTDGPAISIARAREANLDQPIVVCGAITEKCPVAGCWFILRDDSGPIKVDTKNAGFVVVNVPLRKTVVVGGRVVTNGTERLIEATGLRY